MNTSTVPLTSIVDHPGALECELLIMFADSSIDKIIITRDPIARTFILSPEVDPASLLATAPRRKDGMWDLRTRLGQNAYYEFLDNEKQRIKEEKKIS